MTLPELLAPAGSFKALEAAIDAGADAVYFGGESFGARAFAKNFTPEEIREAAKLCRAYGVKSYVTLNTLIYDRELCDMLKYAAFLEKGFLLRPRLWRTKGGKGKTSFPAKRKITEPTFGPLPAIPSSLVENTTLI